MAGLRKKTAMKSGILIVVLVFGSFACGEQADKRGQSHDDPYEGLTVVHRAAKGLRPRSTELYIEILLKAGSDPHAKDAKGFTPLHYAANQPYYLANTEMCFETVEVLLKAGADVNAKDAKGFTPLHYAAMNDATKLAEYLLKAGANLNEKTHSGITPIEAAIHANSSATAEILRRYRVLSP